MIAAGLAMLGALLSNGVILRPGAPTPDVLASRPPTDDPAATGVRHHPTAENESAPDLTTSESAVPPPPPTPRPPVRSSAASSAPAAVTYRSAERLAIIRRGDPKERVFDVFSTVFVKEHGQVVKIEGIRLRASGRSPRDASVEVGEVTLADHAAGETPYWFLFEDGRLLAWGRPEEWTGAAGRYQVDVNYLGRTPADSSN